MFTTSEIKKIVYEPYATPGFINGLENFETQSLLAEIKTSSGTGVEERRLTAMEQQSLFDIQYYLPDDLLTKVD